MSFSHDVEHKLQAYGAQVVESKSGRLSSVPNSMITRRLIEQLATSLAGDAVRVEEDDYSRIHRLQVYVLTPAQLEKYVQRRAERLRPATPDCHFVEETL